MKPASMLVSTLRWLFHLLLRTHCWVLGVDTRV
jgi:hypothetical protein